METNPPNPPNPSKPGARLRIPVLSVLVVLSYVVTVGFFWFPVAREAVQGHSLDATVKNYFLADQLAYMSIARNVQDGGTTRVEPYTETGTSVYPSSYMWALGQVARIGDMGVIAAWNLVGLLVLALLFVAFGYWGRWVTGSKLGWLAGSLPPLLGIFTRPDDPQKWVIAFPPHAVLWPPFAILYNPGAEIPALLVVGAALFCLLRACRAAEPRAARWALAAGGLCGLALNIQIYVAMFGLVACALFFYLDSLRSVPAARLAPGVAVTVAVAALAVAVVPRGSPLARLIVLVVVALGVPLLRRSWRERRLATLVRFAAGLVVGAAPELVVLAAAVRRDDPFLAARQHAVYSLSLPWHLVVLRSLPVLLLVVAAMVWWARGQRRGDDATLVVTLLGSLVVSGALLVFNAEWGLKQEPYRFLPYAALFLAVAAFPWLLVGSGAGRMEVAARVVVAVLLVSTLNSVWQFRHERFKWVLHISDAERRAYHDIAGMLPPDRLVLLDWCLSPGFFKTLTGSPTASFNAGLAYPEHHKDVGAVNSAQHVGHLADIEALRRAQVGLVVRDTTCAEGFPPAEVASTLGSPLRTVVIDDTSVLMRGGMPYELPPPRTLEVYAVDTR